MKLYELTHEYRTLLDRVDPDTGELTPEVSQLLDDLQDPIECKAENIVKVVKELDGEIEALQAEIERLGDRKRARENTAKSLRTYLVNQLDVMQIEKVKTPLFTIRPQNASRPSIRWVGPVEDLPSGLARTRVELDGTAAYQQWKDGTLDNPRFEISLTRFLSIR